MPEARALMALSVGQSALPGLLTKSVLTVECAGTFAAAELQDMPAHAIEGLPVEGCVQQAVYGLGGQE